MQHGSLEDLLFPKHATRQKVTLECQDVIQIALDVATGLKYLHSQSPKIIHRDLNSANILVHSLFILVRTLRALTIYQLLLVG